MNFTRSFPTDLFTSQAIDLSDSDQINKNFDLLINNLAINNRHESSTYGRYPKLNYYVVGLGGLIMFLIGIVTNTLNLLILTRKSMKSTTNKYLSALALCDIFVLVFSQLTTSNSYINDYKETSDSFVYTVINLPTTTPINVDSALLATTANLLSLNSNDSNHTLATNNNYNSLLNPKAAATSSRFWLATLYYKWSVNFYPLVYPYAYPVAIMFQICTVWINLAMSVDRFIAIHFPFKSLKFCTISKAKKAIASIFVLSLVYSIPRFFEYKFVKEKYVLNNETYEFVHIDITRLGMSRYYKKIVYAWMYVLLQSVVPLAMLTFINMALVYSLKESSKVLQRFNARSNLNDTLRRSSQPTSASATIAHTHTTNNANTSNHSMINKQTVKMINKEIKRKDITIMLITVVVLFILFQTPAVICNCFYGLRLYKSSREYIEAFEMNALCPVGNFLIVTCSASNFFIYCVFNKRFRAELVDYALRCMCLRAKGIKKKSTKRHSSLTQNSLMSSNSTNQNLINNQYLVNLKPIQRNQINSQSSMNSKKSKNSTKISQSKKKISLLKSASNPIAKSKYNSLISKKIQQNRKHSDLDVTNTYDYELDLFKTSEQYKQVKAQNSRKKIDPPTTTEAKPDLTQINEEFSSKKIVYI
jgi:hypothetical protein